MTIDLTVENTSLSTVFNAELRLRFPPGVNTLSNSSIVDGSCAGTIVNNSACDPREVVVWPLGTLTLGQQVVVSIAPVVANATVDGSLIPWRASLVEDNGSWANLQETLCIDSGGFLPGGACPSPDSDADGVPEWDFIQSLPRIRVDECAYLLIHFGGGMPFGQRYDRVTRLVSAHLADSHKAGVLEKMNTAVFGESE